MMTESFEVRLCEFLVAVRLDDGRVQPDAGHTLTSCRSAIRTGGSDPACAHACRRALFNAAVTLRRPRSPQAADSFSARHTVGTDATGPNSSRWSPITRKSLITRAPSAIAHARSANTRPRS